MSRALELINRYLGESDETQDDLLEMALEFTEDELDEFLSEEELDYIAELSMLEEGALKKAAVGAAVAGAAGVGAVKLRRKLKLKKAEKRLAGAKANLKDCKPDNAKCKKKWQKSIEKWKKAVAKWRMKA